MAAAAAQMREQQQLREQQAEQRRGSNTLTRKGSGIPLFQSPIKAASPGPYNGGGLSGLGRSPSSAGYSPSSSGQMGQAGQTGHGGGMAMGPRSNSAIDPAAVR